MSGARAEGTPLRRPVARGITLVSGVSLATVLGQLVLDLGRGVSIIENRVRREPGAGVACVRAPIPLALRGEAS